MWGSENNKDNPFDKDRNRIQKLAERLMVLENKVDNQKVCQQCGMRYEWRNKGGYHDSFMDVSPYSASELAEGGYYAMTATHCAWCAPKARKLDTLAAWARNNPAAARACKEAAEQESK